MSTSSGEVWTCGGEAGTERVESGSKVLAQPFCSSGVKETTLDVSPCTALRYAPTRTMRRARATREGPSAACWARAGLRCCCCASICSSRPPKSPEVHKERRSQSSWGVLLPRGTCKQELAASLLKEACCELAQQGRRACCELAPIRAVETGGCDVAELLPELGGDVQHRLRRQGSDEGQEVVGQDSASPQRRCCEGDAVRFCYWGRRPLPEGPANRVTLGQGPSRDRLVPASAVRRLEDPQGAAASCRAQASTKTLESYTRGWVQPFARVHDCQVADKDPRFSESGKGAEWASQLCALRRQTPKGHGSSANWGWPICRHRQRRVRSWRGHTGVSRYCGGD